MEEAEVLCDRLGIFVDGSLQCIGNPKQVTSLEIQHTFAMFTFCSCEVTFFTLVGFMKVER